MIERGVDDLWFYVRFTYDDGFEMRPYCTLVKRDIKTSVMEVSPADGYHC